MKIILPFDRPTIAYLQDGTQVASGVPRYETGLCDQGIWIEEGTTNVFLNSDAPVTQSIAVTTANSGKWTTTVWGAGTVTTSSGSATASGYGVASTGNPNTVTVTVNGTVVFTVAGADATTKVQVENQAYGTSHMVTAGASATRAAETLTMPTAGVFTKGSWTVEFVVEPTSTQVVTGKYGRLWMCYIDANNYYSLVVNPVGQPYFEAVSGGVSANTYNAGDPVLALGTKYRIWSKMNGTTMCHGVNAVKGLAGNVAYTEPVGTLPANMYLGSGSDGGNHANGIYDEWATSSTARTDADLAARGASTAPLERDEYTTLKANFNNSLYAIKNRLIKPILRPTTKPWTYC